MDNYFGISGNGSKSHHVLPISDYQKQGESILQTIYICNVLHNQRSDSFLEIQMFRM